MRQTRVKLHARHTSVSLVLCLHRIYFAFGAILVVLRAYALRVPYGIKSKLVTSKTSALPNVLLFQPINYHLKSRHLRCKVWSPTFDDSVVVSPLSEIIF